MPSFGASEPLLFEVEPALELLEDFVADLAAIAETAGRVAFRPERGATQSLGRGAVAEPLLEWRGAGPLGPMRVQVAQLLGIFARHPRLMGQLVEPGERGARHALPSSDLFARGTLPGEAQQSRQPR